MFLNIFLSIINNKVINYKYLTINFSNQGSLIPRLHLITGLKGNFLVGLSLIPA